MKLITVCFLFCWACPYSIIGQSISVTEIDRSHTDANSYISNPSFEQIDNKIIRNPRGSFDRVELWVDCGEKLFPLESPPDLMKNNFTMWGVNHRASKGEYFISLVARENDTYESFSQELITPLKKDSCYSFKIDLCTSAQLRSGTTSITGSRNSELENYDAPVVFNAYAGNRACEIDQLLSGDVSITNTEWQAYLIEFQAEKNYDFITFAVYWNPPYFTLANGNILIDNIREFSSKSCKN